MAWQAISKFKAASIQSVHFTVKRMKAAPPPTAGIKSKPQDAAGIFVMPAVNLLARIRGQLIKVSEHQKKRSTMHVI